jgi:shikimate kinase / 3-dehydroquinate synthase
MDQVVLIGMPGSGKTTVGKSLARQLGLPFVDSDKEIVARTGVSIATIFEIEGEEAFRKREAQVIAELLAQGRQVLATGGGAILNADTRARLHSTGITVYLRASLDSLVERTSKDAHRPLLASGAPREKLAALMTVRDPFYRETAHLTFDTGRQSPGRLAASIAQAVRPRLADNPSHSQS